MFVGAEAYSSADGAPKHCYQMISVATRVCSLQHKSTNDEYRITNTIITGSGSRDAGTTGRCKREAVIMAHWVMLSMLHNTFRSQAMIW